MYSRELVDYDYSVLKDQSLWYTRYLDEKCPPCPMITFKEEKGETTVFESKIGGIPYMPIGGFYPEYMGRPLGFVAQLNFEELPPIEGFPEKGILQFYIACSLEEYNEYKCRSYSPKNDAFRVIYHRDIIMNREKLMKKNMPNVFPCYFSETEMKLKVDKTLLCPVTFDNYYASFALNYFANSPAGEADIYSDLYDDWAEKGIRSNHRTCTGGYPSIGSSSNIQLFQLEDNKSGMVIRYAISKDKLQILDFTDARCSIGEIRTLR